MTFDIGDKCLLQYNDGDLLVRIYEIQKFPDVDPQYKYYHYEVLKSWKNFTNVNDKSWFMENSLVHVSAILISEMTGKLYDI